MFLYYKNKDEIINFEISSFNSTEEYDEMKLTNAIKVSVTRKLKISFDDYILQNYKFKIKKCGFCGYYAWYDLKFKFESYKNSYIVIINKLIYSKNSYCRGKNKNCDGKKYNPNSVEFVSRTRNITNDQALKIIHNRNKSPFYLNNHKNYSEYKKYQSVKIRLNDDNKYAEFIKNLKYSKTVDYYIEKYGELEGKEIFSEISKKKDSMSFNYILNKNNNDYKKSIIEFKTRVKSVMPKGGTSYLGGFYSKQSFDFFTKLINIINFSENDIIFGDNEFFIEYFDDKLNKKRRFFYDFIDLKNKIIIEFNGKRWHPNKEKMSTEEYDNWYHPFDKEILKEDLEYKDIFKKEVAIKNGYEIIVVWDCDGLDYNYNLVYEYYKK